MVKHLLNCSTTLLEPFRNVSCLSYFIVKMFRAHVYFVVVTFCNLLFVQCSVYTYVTASFILSMLFTFVVCELFCHDYDIVSVSFPFWSCTIYNICEICHCYSCIYLVIFPVYIMQCVTCSLCICLFSVITAVVYNAGFSSDGFWRCGISQVWMRIWK